MSQTTSTTPSKLPPTSPRSQRTFRLLLMKGSGSLGDDVGEQGVRGLTILQFLDRQHLQLVRSFRGAAMNLRVGVIQPAQLVRERVAPVDQRADELGFPARLHLECMPGVGLGRRNRVTLL